VVATVGAFFVTTRLKRSNPVIEQLTFRRYFSPNRDGRFDAAQFAFRLRRTDEVTVSIVNREGDEVRTLVQDILLRGGRRHRFRWDGRNEVGRVAPNGEYHLRVGLRRQGRTVTSARKLFLDTVPPRPVVKHVSPDSISPDGAGGANSATFRFSGPVRRARLLVYRTDLRRPRLVSARPIPGEDATARWDGHVAGGRPAASGAYLLVVRAQDAAGNVGPRRVPPRRAEVRGHPGVAVRYVDARGTRPVVESGQRAGFAVSADGRRYRWSMRRLGSGRVLERGSGRSGTLAVPVRSARSGVAVLSVRVGVRRHLTPFAVQGRRRAKVLMVLPDATWQARNRLETDGDGYPDLLPEDRRVTLLRPYAGDGLPPGFAGDQSGLLRFLDRERLRYDITTDVALASPAAPSLDPYTGVLYAGPPRFAPVRTQGLLRAHVEAGGRLAWIGRGGFDWSVHVTRRAKGGSGPDTLLRGRRPTVRALFGERLRYEREPVPVAVLSDRIGFFRDVPGSFGPFGPLEESLRLPPEARLLASAGTGEDRRALVVYRRGGGVVTRVGVDGFGRALRTSPAAARIMRRLWVLLSR
jgi:N,N-dimethylformamidase beta subunit-like protein/flagellar hook capping protein FlgD